jgi:hypothetical protein
MRHQIVTLAANCGRSAGVPFAPPCLASQPTYIVSVGQRPPLMAGFSDHRKPD